MIIKDEYWCIYCCQHRKSEFFSNWIDGKVKSRKCDYCCDSQRAKEKAVNNEIECKAKVKYDKEKKSNKSNVTIADRNKCEVRRRIDEFNDAKLLKEFD